MIKQTQREPAFEDTDTIWFGRFKDTLLQDVPARYLSWWYGTAKERGIDKWSTANCNQFELKDLMLYNYIFNARDTLQQEFPDFT